MNYGTNNCRGPVRFGRANESKLFGNFGWNKPNFVTQVTAHPFESQVSQEFPFCFSNDWAHENFNKSCNSVQNIYPWKLTEKVPALLVLFKKIIGQWFIVIQQNWKHICWMNSPQVDCIVYFRVPCASLWLLKSEHHYHTHRKTMKIKHSLIRYGDILIDAKQIKIPHKI